MNEYENFKRSMATIDPSPIDLNSDLIQTPSNAKVEKSNAIMNQMIATGQITPEGSAWLKLNTDPWHDSKTNGFRGIPSRNANQVVTMSVVQELQLAKPASLAAGNWCCRISSYPISGSIDVKQYAKTSGMYWGQAELASKVHPIQVDFSSDDQFTEISNTDTIGMQIPNEYTNGTFQVAGMGLEVINTTATLQKQGLATCAVMNQATSANFAITATNNSDGTVHPVSFTVFPVKTVPSNLSEMMLLPGTTQWEAAEGAYSVIQLTDLDAPPTGVPKFPLFIGGELATNANVYTADIAGVNFGAYPTKYQSPIGKTNQVPMNSTIHMYTGLSEQTTLTVRVRYLIVKYPNDTEKQILVLAYNNAPWDPVALELQARLLIKLPPAVMFKLNPKGEWWKSMIAGIADIASSGLLMMPHPLAKGAGAAIAAGRNMILPDEKVRLKAARTKTGGTPAQRQANQQQKQQQKKKNKKKKKKGPPAKGA